MSASILAEGTRVRIIRYEKRPEFAGAEAEIGNYSEKDNTYECWMIADAFEGSYALCSPADFEVVQEEQKEKPAAEAAPPESATAEPPAASNETAGQSVFGVGDRVRGKESGKLGIVVSVDDDGDPKVLMDGSSEALQRFGKEFDVAEKASFGVGDRVRGRDSGKTGTVVSVDEDGDPKVLIDGEDEAQQRFGKEFEILEKPSLTRAESRSRSNDKKKGKKKKKQSSSSSSSSSSRSRSRRRGKRSGSSASSRYRKKGSAFGRSTMEKKADEKRRAKKIKRSAGVGANAALSLLGMK